MSVSDVFAGLLRHPIRNVVQRWNWKAAAMSAVSRALVFGIVNLQAGPGAGLRALGVEFCLRAATAGFYGTITQSFSGARPAWAASLAALLFLPALAHGIEFIVHWLAGTVLLRQSIAASVFFTVAATAFNLFAMRRNVLTVGRDSQSLIDDLRQLPGTILAFSTTLPRALLRLRAKERLAAMSAPAVAAAVETGQTDA